MTSTYWSERLKTELAAQPPCFGEPCPPIFEAGLGGFPIGVGNLLLELVERLDELEEKVKLEGASGL